MRLIIAPPVMMLVLHRPACSSTHVPSYINHPKLKDAGKAFVISVNDPFVYVCDRSVSSPHRFLLTL
jgi:peroxiredoxin